MHVVATCVHHRLLSTVKVNDSLRAGVGKAGSFFNRKGIHVGAGEHSGAGTVAKDGGNTMASDI